MNAVSSKLRYLIVGGLCALVHNAIMIGGDAVRLHYAVSTAIAFVVLLLMGFFLNARFTFAVDATIRAFVRYAGATAMNYPLWLALMFLFYDVAHMPMVIASPLGTGLFVIWNYVISRWALTRPRQTLDPKCP